MVNIDLFRNEPNRKTVPAGTLIFEEGQAGDRMYAVLQGSVEVRKGGTVVADLEAGAVFGEMAVIDHQPRSASAYAKTDCVLVEVNERRFLFLVQQTPFFALQMLRMMAERLRRNLES
jgi:CRP-like cAMP-binding protein